MAKKKQPTIVDIVDDLVSASSPVSNGHDAEGMAVAEESGELDEMMEPEPPAPRRKRAVKAQVEDELPEKPAHRRRAPR